MKKNTACCFIGQPERRLDPKNNSDEKLKMILQEEIEKQIVDFGVTHFISGMAMGYELYAAEAVLGLKTKYPEITLECVFPYETQSAKWSSQTRELYYDIASECDKETLLQRRYTSDCMRRRNRYMVDNSHTVITLSGGKTDNTEKAVRYAKEQNKATVFLNI